MSSITTSPISRTVSARRAQVLAESVISGYINELSPRRRGRGEAHAPEPLADSAPAAAGRSEPTGWRDWSLPWNRNGARRPVAARPCEAPA